jgi:hypothetical protein
MPIRRLSPTALLLAATLAPLPQAAMAWGHRGHAVIDRAAIAALPADGPVFLRGYADYIAASATLPDSWRSASEPFSKIEEDPNHGWFREQFRFLKPVPRSRYAFVLALHEEYLRIRDSDPAAAARTNIRWTGTLPYAALEGYGRLVSGMRMLRAARAKGDDTRFLEQSCAFYVAWMGHYVGDGAQPLHDSVNSDGWRGPNPRGYTRDARIHGRFESDFVEAIGLDAKDVVPRLPPSSALDGDLFDAMLAYLDRAGDRMERVYQLDQRGAFADPSSAEGRAMVIERTAAGAGMLRDMLVRAWRESARPATQVSPGPLDQANPAYDSETGSAPPPRG